jgi:radical SAM superfamily enzyme YgiQ (UPF0313 family)
VDYIDTDIVKAMAAAQFVIIRLGIEDLDDSILRKVKKDIVADQSLQAIETIRSADPRMIIHAYMLTGLPGSTMETLAKATHSIHALIHYQKVDIIGNKILVPYPGTPYFEFPERHQMQILHHNWSAFDRLSFPVYRTATLSEYQTYFGFLTLESVQLQAYEAKIANARYIDQASPESLDYVYRSYVQQIGLQLGADNELIEKQSIGR